MKELELENCDFKLFIHKTAEDIVSEFFGGSYEDSENLEGHYTNGDPYSISVKDLLENIKERKCWGYSNKKNKWIHLWFSPDVNPQELIALIAHERSHLLRPFHKYSSEEEIKAGKYENVTAFSFDVLEILLKNSETEEKIKFLENTLFELARVVRGRDAYYPLNWATKVCAMLRDIRSYNQERYDREVLGM